MLPGQNHHAKSITLAELLIAISLLGLVILAATSIDLFARRQLREVDIRTQLINEISPAMEHMVKSITQGTGNINNNALYLWGNGFRVRVDMNRPPTPSNYDDDTWVGYHRFYIPGQNIYQIRYYRGILSPFNPPNQNTPYEDIIARLIPDNGANFTLSENNTVIDIILRARQQPNQDVTIDNPEVEIRSRSYCRSASAN